MRRLSDGTPILAKPKMIDTLETVLEEAYETDEQEVLVCVEGYVSRKSKKVANITLNVAYDYATLVREAIEHVEAFEAYDHSIAPQAVWDTAKAEVLESLNKSLLNRNPNDYISRSSEQLFPEIPNVLVGFSSGMIQVRGIMTDYELLDPGEEKKVNSRPKTLCKKAMFAGTFRGEGIGALRTMALDTPRFDHININNMRYDSSGFSMEVEDEGTLRVFNGFRGGSSRIEITDDNREVNLSLGESIGSEYRLIEDHTVTSGSRKVSELRADLGIGSSAIALKQIITPKTIRSETLTAVVSGIGRVQTAVMTGSSKNPTKIGPSPGSRVFVEVKRESTKVKADESIIFMEPASSQIIINLNWNRVSHAIDLDLCALIELQDGTVDCIEAIRGNFGDIDDAPFVLHSGDDLTGDFAEGEYLHIDYEHLKKIKRICVFAYIYRGASSWKNAKGVIQVDVPGNPIIEVAMGEQTSRSPLCAICMIEVDEAKDQVKLERLVSFHGDMQRYQSWDGQWQRDLDSTYNFNMNW